LSGAVKTVQIVGSISVKAAAVNPAASSAQAGEGSILALAVDVSAGPVEAVELIALRVQAGGSGDDGSEIAGVSMYLDDGDGLFDPVRDCFLSRRSFPADDNKLKFSMSKLVPANATATLFVAYDFGPYAKPGSQFLASIDSDADVTATGLLSGVTIQASGAPVQGGLLIVIARPASSVSGGCGGGTGDPSPASAAGILLLLAAGLVAARMARGFGRARS
jgi:hypothetical protein